MTDEEKKLQTAQEKLDARAEIKKCKQSLYFPESMLQEMRDEAARLDRSLSWVVQRAWKLSKKQLAEIPAIED